MRPERLLAIALVAGHLGFAAAASASLGAAVLPPRSPDPGVGDEPWPGLRPVDAGDARFPLADLAAPERWRSRIEAFRPPVIFRVASPVPAPVLAPPAIDDAARARWRRALEAARANDGAAVLAALAAEGPLPLPAERLERRLAFAAAVSLGDRAAADSLFFRIAWDDNGVAAARLAAWRYLAAGDADGAERALRPLDAADPGVAAARGWVWWATRPADPGDAVPPPAGDAARDAMLALLAARRAALAGDNAAGAAVLESWPESRVPEAWRETRRRLAGVLRVSEGAAAPDDEREFTAAAGAWAGGRDAEAADALRRWLDRWPVSAWRGQAYLLLAELRLEAGNAEEARGDVEAAARLTGDALALRVEVDRAWLAALERRPDEVRRRIDAARARSDAASAEDELLYDRLRFERLAGDAAGAEATRLLLEEGYPDSRWNAVARGAGETLPAPPRRLPPPPANRAVVDAPRGGPWFAVLWGADVLPATAASLAVDGEAIFAADAPAPEPVAPEGVAADADTPWSGLLSAGGGSRLTAYLEGGLLGEWDRVAVRARVDGLRTEDPGDLPSAQRGGFDASVFARGERWRGSVVGEVRARKEDAMVLPAPAGGPADVVGPISARWSGLRFDMAPVAGGEAGAVRAALGEGRLELPQEGTWSRRELWLRGDRAWGAGWRGEAQLVHRRDEYSDAAAHDALNPDLRVTRRFRSGAWLGGRATLVGDRGMLLPVAGIARSAGRWTASVATEPELAVPSFRDRFVLDADRNVPGGRLAPVRRDRDARGDLGWSGDAVSGGLSGAWYRAGGFRSWRRDGALFREVAMRHAVVAEATARLEVRPAARFVLRGETTFRRAESGGIAVPYVATSEIRVDARWAEGAWIWQSRLLAVSGRRDDADREYGSFARWDVEATYRLRPGMEYSFRIENVLNDADPRWPGYPPYGRGVFGGVRLLFGAGQAAPAARLRP